MRLRAASIVLIVLLPPRARAEEGPQHLAQAFFQYGVAFTGEFVAAPGPICSVAGTSGCILGTGGGLSVHLGKRFRSPFYVGGAYEFAKMDSAQLYRVGILQQLRAEGRYYLSTATVVQPYFDVAIGLAAYGNLWAFDALGLAFGVGGGAEFQLSRYLALGVTLHYRPIFFAQFTDSSAGQNQPPVCASDPSCHPAGFAHLISLDLVIETREPL